VSTATTRINSPAASVASPIPPKATTANSAKIVSHSFASVLSTQSNGTPYTDAEVKSFFSTNPSHAAIADKAASLGLNKDQIVAAMRVAGFGGQAVSELKSGVDSFVADASNGFAWGESGKLVVAKETISELAPGSDLSKFSVGQVADRVYAWAAQGLEMAEIARRAEAGGVDQETMNTLSAMNQGAGRLAIDNAYANYSLQQTMVAGVAQDSGRFVRLGSPKGPSLTDAQQLWNAQHSGMYTDNAAVGGNFSWSDAGGWQRAKIA
jgi:hypothetical protein